MSLPQRLGRYEVVEVLGMGAMGTVYRATDPVIDRDVAVKVVQAHPSISVERLAAMEARFEQEFRSAGALNHPNIVTIYDVGREGENYYIAMEFVQGEDLDSVLEAGRVLTFKEVSDLAREVCGALDYAHDHGVVHRDIKPANIMITREGVAKITDFGLAKIDTTTLTRTGMVIGTPAYMSPEQVGSQAVTGASDQFSAAIILYEALTGERPFTGESPSAIMYKIVHEEPVPPQVLNKNLPPAVNEVLMRALQKASEARYARCAEMAEDLRIALGAAPALTIAYESGMPAMPPEATVADEGAGAASAAQPSTPGVAETPRPSPQVSASASAAQPVAASTSAAQPVAPLTPAAQPVPATVSQAPTPRFGTWFTAIMVGLPTIGLVGVIIWLVLSGRSEIGFDPTADLPIQSPATSESGAAPEQAGGIPEGPGENQSQGGEIAVTEEVGQGGTQARGSTEVDADLGEEATTQPSGPPTPGSQATPKDRQEAVIEGAPATRPNVRQPAARDSGRVGSIPATRRQALWAWLLEATEPAEVSVAAPYMVALRISGRPDLPPQVAARLRRATKDQRDQLGREQRLPAQLEHRVQLPPGEYRISVLAPQVFYRRSELLRIEAGQHIQLGAPETVRVHVDSDPGSARVTIDGFPAPETPFESDITAGEHEFRFRWSGTDQERVVRARIEADGQRVSASPQQRQ